MTNPDQLSVNEFCLTKFPEPVGYMKLWDDFFVGCKTKPSEEHLESMRSSFGWEWMESINGK